MYWNSWRYFRNLLILGVFVLTALFGIAWSFYNPINWFWVAPLCYLAYIIWQIFWFVHPYRRRYLLPVQPMIGSAGYEKVLIKSRDGLTLFGWFLPGFNQAAIILVHGLGSSGIDLIYHAAPFVAVGYNVLLIDLRAHGSSDGDTSTFGLREGDDVACAVDFLRLRTEVDPNKIGAVGISLGAQAVLRGALKTPDLQAIVLEGLGPAILKDHGGKPKSLRRKFYYPLNWFYYCLSEFMIGEKDQGVLDLISAIAPRSLMLIACGKREIYFNRMFFADANEPKTIWELPKVQHASAISDPDYASKLLLFFNNTLQPVQK